MSKESLPRGVRRRGDKLFVDVSATVNGVKIRKTATCHELTEALIKQAQFKKELDAEARGVPIETGDPEKDFRGTFNWTLRQACEKVKNLPAPDGWMGSKSELKMSINCEAAIAFFGPGCPLKDIRTNEIDSYITSLSKLGNSNGTINRKLSALSKVMKVAESRSNDRYTKPKFPKRLRESKGRIRQFSQDEEKAMLAWCKKTAEGELHDVIVVLLDTGLRVSELFGVSHEDVDTRNKVLLVYGRTSTGTKNGEFRSVFMTARVSAIFAQRKFSHAAKPFPYDTHWLGRHWAKLRDFMGMEDDPQFIPHTLRHTCASRLIQRKISLIVVQQWLGHKTIQMTMRYAHLYPKDLQDARDALEPTKETVDP